MDWRNCWYCLEDFRRLLKPSSAIAPNAWKLHWRNKLFHRWALRLSNIEIDLQILNFQVHALIFHGCSTQIPLVFHGKPKAGISMEYVMRYSIDIPTVGIPWIDSPWKSMDTPWISMVDQWNINGISMEYPWSDDGIPWNMHGMSIGYPWNIHGMPV